MVELNVGELLILRALVVHEPEFFGHAVPPDVTKLELQSKSYASLCYTNTTGRSWEHQRDNFIKIEFLVDLQEDLLSMDEIGLVLVIRAVGVHPQ